MIKSLHKLLVPKREADFHALADFFDALGLARGEAWKGRRSQGVKLEAPEAGIEIGHGHGFPDADLVIEVDSADAAYELARQRGLHIVKKIADQDWDARLFVVEMPAGAGRLAVFSYNKDWRKKAPGPEGKLDARGKRFAIVAGRFNAFVTDRLLAGALDALRRAGAQEKGIVTVRVPGSFEIPSAARTLAQSGKYDAIVCLGCILRGQTSHYEHLANEVARGIGQSAQETGVPHAFGVLTCDTLEQAIDRAGLKSGNKGYEAALSAVEMANLRADVRRRTSGVSRKRRKKK
ncbi:MAG TPA: 6,7-dimethyl-8-ribityllumazine synthase [Terriglobales bacterium]|nr:6,7-dimethyl-8-ribityllumazine synthase [Terriglobales bacterium]